MYQPPRREPEIDLEQVLNRIRTALSGVGGRFGGGSILTYLTFGILGLSLIIWISTGIYTVGPGEKAALRTFGIGPPPSGPEMWSP